MQTVRDATILTILILVLASVRIGPVAETDGPTELPEVRTAGIGLAPTMAPEVTSAIAPDPLPASRRTPAIRTPATRTATALKPIALNPFAPQTASFAPTGVPHRIQTVESVEIDVKTSAGLEDDTELVIVQVAEMIEEWSDAAIAEFGDHARDAIERVECPKTRFKVNARF